MYMMNLFKQVSILVSVRIVILSVVLCQDKNVIKLQNSGYSNVLIAIHKDVAEDETIIENLKTMYTDASERLYLASRQHVYWKEFKILVPVTWSQQSEYGVAKTESFETSNIIVHHNAASRGDEPYVDNPYACGKEGLLTHLTPKYILDENYRESTFGPTDKVLVRNWAYFRWGIFPEHYDESHYDKGARPAYDAPGGVVEGTRCSLTIHGKSVMPDGTLCQSQANDLNGYPKTCRLELDDVTQTATASLAFRSLDVHINSIEEFCDEDPPYVGGFHNPEAPNLQNIHCGGDSAWRVMKKRTTDFVNGSQDIPDRTPVFTVFRAPSKRSVVLVLDISGSMDDYNRFVKMIQSSTEYIMNIIPDGSQLGIVSFSTSASIHAALTEIQDETRPDLVNLLPKTPDGSTSIGSGVLKGIEVLDIFSSGGFMLLMSDGYENQDPFIEDTYGEVESSGVIIDTIAISDQADPEMETLSDMTNGLAEFCSDSNSGSCLISAFQRTITERPDVGLATVPVQIFSADVSVPSSASTTVSVIIDAALGNDTVFTVTWIVNDVVSVEVISPNGTTIDGSDPRYHVDLTIKIISINLQTAQAGLWTIAIFNPEGRTEEATAGVTSKPSTDQIKPVTVRVILGSRDIDYSQLPALAIYAQVQQDYEPVVDAVVEATITNTNGATSTVLLLDNGSGSDLEKGDGTYSSFFLDFVADGRHNVKVDVLGSEQVDLPVYRNERVQRSNQAQESTPSFMRTASGGVFEVKSYTLNAPDTLAPSRIQDLAYTSFSYDDSTVNLTWTAVGDDLDQGTASSYELRYATNFTTIKENFNASVLVTDDQVVDGNISVIAPAGQVETITIELPERGKDIVFYFSIRAWDEAENAGDSSNIASLAIRIIPLPNDQDNLALIIGLSCAAVIIILVVVGIVAGYYCRRKSKQPKSVDSSDVNEKNNPSYSDP